MKNGFQYKETGLYWCPKIPEDWQIKKLKYVALVQSSNVDKKSLPDEPEVLLCNYVDVYKNEFITIDLNFMKATAKPEQIEKFKLKIGDVLITKDSETPDDIAVPALSKIEKDNLICGYHLAQIRANSVDVVGEYIFRLFQSKEFNSNFEIAANGITRFGLSIDAIKSVYIPIPPVKQQKVIARFLDLKTAEIDNLISKKQKLIDHLKEERIVQIRHLVTKGVDNYDLIDSRIDWIGDIPREWEVKKLKYVAKKVQTGNTPPTSKDEYYGEDFNWFTPSDFNENLLLENSNRKISHLAVDDEVVRVFPENSVLIVGIGATLGKVGYIVSPASSNQQINAILFSTLEEAKFYANLFYAFKDVVLSKSNAATLAILNQTQTKDFMLPVPTENQLTIVVEEIENLTDRIENAIQKIEKEIDLIKEYRNSLITETVTGKTIVN